VVAELWIPQSKKLISYTQRILLDELDMLKEEWDWDSVVNGGG
jgi:hypothetical protein